MNDQQSNGISLVLGAGGARGYAHIGVIHWLVEHGYEIKAIAGSSMGALIGGIYAAGKLDTFTEWALALNRRDVLLLLDPAFERNGLFKGERIMDELRRSIGDHDIEKLPISFTAVAMDLDTGKEVWIRRGKLFDAIRASIAIPMLLTPFYDGRRRLVDGGLINPIPIMPTLTDTSEMTVAVNLGGRAEAGVALQTKPVATNQTELRQRISSFIESLRMPSASSPSSLWLTDVGLRSMEAMQNTIGQLKLAACSPDVTITIPRNACRIHEFWRADELMQLGYVYASQAFSKHVDEALGSAKPKGIYVE